MVVNVSVLCSMGVCASKSLLSVCMRSFHFPKNFILRVRLHFAINNRFCCGTRVYYATCLGVRCACY